MQKTIGIILTTIGILGYIVALVLGMALWEQTAPFPIIIIFISTAFTGIGIGMISEANEQNNCNKR